MRFKSRALRTLNPLQRLANRVGLAAEQLQLGALSVIVNRFLRPAQATQR
jgi:hypothetical protein